MAEHERKCPYCGHITKNNTYWRHLESQHSNEYNSDQNSWLKLFEDYTSMGMDKESSISVICQLFNQETTTIKEYLSKSGKI